MLSRIRNDIDKIRQAEKALRESEEKYKLIFDSANDAIFIHSFEGQIMSANSLAIERLGYPREVLLSMSVKDVDAPEEGDEPEKRIAIVMERDHLTFETVHKCSDGTLVPVEVSARKIVWDGLPAIMSICRDTTFRKIVEKALQESEKKYHSIFDNAAEGIFQTSPDGRFLSANPALATMFGYESPEDLINSITDLSTQGYVNPADRERYRQLLEKNDIIRGFEVQHYRKDRSLLWIRISARTVRDESGVLLYYEGTLEDVTDRKRAEEELRIAHERLSDIIEFLPDATFVIDRAKRVVAWNKACVKMTGVSQEDMIGKGDYAYAVPFYGERRPILIDLVTMDSDFIGQHYKSVTQAGNTLYGEVFVPNVYDGKGAFLAGHASTLLDREGNIVGAIESVRDITELRHLEAQLHQSQKMEAIGTLAGGIAHDFNNLLTTIIGYGSLLQKDIENADPRKQYLNQILQSSQKAASLTQSLLAFSRKQVIELKPQSLNSLLKNIEKILKRLLTEDIEFRVVLAEPDVAIMGDVTQIDQILINLATNARDAMPRGGSLVISVDQVILSSEYGKVYGYLEPGAYAVISVNDTGCGMDEATKDKIFEPFFTTKEVGRGTGLGLSIVYGIVKQHDGYINVYSEPGKGSVFKIYIPAIKSHVEAEEESEGLEMPGGSETLLVAEDNDALRGLTRELLTRKGYSVVEAADGEDAVSKFTEHKDSIDLVLLDVVMPRKNGKEAYESIRKMRPDIKTLFMSGYTGDVVRTKEVQDETVDFISKPMLPGDLLLKIREILDR